MTLKARHWIMAAAAAGSFLAAVPAFADVRAGIELWRAGNYTAAIAEWRPLAEAGDADAQFNMGQAFKLGRGVPLDVRQAQVWYEMAARQGHAQAEANLGLTLFQNGQQQQAMPWIVRAAERGDPRAQYVLGTAHFNGDLIQRDWPLAYALMRAAAEQDLPNAVTSLAEMERHLSPEEKQRSEALLRQINASAPPTQMATNTMVEPSPPPRASQNAPGAIVRTPVPPSRPAPAMTASRPAPVVTAPRPAQPAPRPAPPVRVATPAPTPAPAAAATGRWRVQLGAFGQRGNAERQWAAARRVGALSGSQHYLVPAGNVTRLQAGPFASRAAADRACGAVRAAGHACIVVAP